MIFDSRFLKPVKLSGEKNQVLSEKLYSVDIPEDKTIPDYLQEKMKESRVRPMPDQLFRRTIPRRQAPVTQQPQVTVTPELLQKLNQITEGKILSTDSVRAFVQFFLKLTERQLSAI